MARLPLIVPLAVLALFCAGWSEPGKRHADPPVSSRDAAQIYGEFLTSWFGRGKSPINVSKSADAPSSETIGEFSECAKQAKNDGNPQWLAAEPIADLSGTIGNVARVHLVDATTWKAADPGDLIAQGKSVDSAVASGFAQGFLTLSAITYSASHNVAALNYSFVCGELCGNGGIVIFKRTDNGWVRAKRICGSWMSLVPSGGTRNFLSGFPSTSGV